MKIIYVPFWTPPQLNSSQYCQKNVELHSVLDDDDFGILNSSSTDIYLKITAPNWSINTVHEYIKVTITNGSAMTSSAKATLDISKLPPEVQTSFIIPGLNKTLISVTNLCAAGCNVLFGDEKCIVTYRENVVPRAFATLKMACGIYHSWISHTQQTIPYTATTTPTLLAAWINLPQWKKQSNSHTNVSFLQSLTHCARPLIMDKLIGFPISLLHQLDSI